MSAPVALRWLVVALALLASAPARGAPVDWSVQRAAWDALRARMAPLARAGAVMPTPKLERAFHREGVWFVPRFQPSALPAAARALLAPDGPVAAAVANGPAGRAVYVDVAAAASPEARAAALGVAGRWCTAAAARCGLGCTLAPPPPSWPQGAEVRRLVRLRTDHDLIVEIRPGARAPLVHLPIPEAGEDARLEQALRTAVAAAGLAVTPIRMPRSRLPIGLLVDGDPGRGPASPLVEALCHLGGEPADRLLRAWTEPEASRVARDREVARWLGLAFVDRPASSRRGKLEDRYLRVHYRGQVSTLWRRPSDRAWLFRPALVVLHHTGGMSITAALHTLTATAVPPGPKVLEPGTVSVGAAYLVGRDGVVIRLFDDDRRFARHAIGLGPTGIGIENVGDYPHAMTPEQVEVNGRLLAYLAMRHPLRYLIGHRDVYQMARTPYYVEQIQHYCTSKSDPNLEALRRIRARTEGLGFEGPPSTAPVLKDCPQLRAFLRERDRQERHERARARALRAVP